MRGAVWVHGLGFLLLLLDCGTGQKKPLTLNPYTLKPNIGALIIRIGLGFWGPLYYIHNKEPTKMVLVVI